MPETDTGLDLGTVVWVLDKRGLAHLTQYAIPTSDRVTFDLETTGLNEHALTGGLGNGGVAARVVLASYTLDHDDRRTTYLIPLSHPDSPFLGQWRKVLALVSKRMAGKQLVGHNAKFDLRWINAITGIDLSRDLHWDTMVSSHLLDENASSKLKEVVPRTFEGVERWDDFDLTRPGAAERVDLFQLGEYAALDTIWTDLLYEKHYDDLVGSWLEEPPAFPDEIELARLGDLMLNVSMPTARTLTAIEQRGLYLDTSWVASEREKLQDAATDAFNELATRYTGEAVPSDPGAVLDPDSANFAPTSLWFQAWAEVAVSKGDLRVAALTPTGKPQWSKAVLARQERQGSEVAELLLEYRDANKRSEFLTSWLEKVSPDGKIHAQYNIGSVTTGRLSSSEPNMQQVTRTLKPAFTPTEGYYLAELDFSQIELRVAAFISRCQPMIEAFQRGDDLHTLLAARIAGKDPSEVTKSERQSAKAANFGLLYGMGVATFRDYAEDSYGTVLSEEEAAAAHQAFFDLWEGLRDWHNASGVNLDRTGQVVSPLGRIRRLGDMVMFDEFRAQRAAVNSPVQGMASDIMQIAASIIEGVNPLADPIDTRARLVGTVHDSILLEVPVDGWEEAVDQCKAAMESGVLTVLHHMGCEFDIPLVVDYECGTAWGLNDIAGD